MAIKAEKSFSLKDDLFNKDSVGEFAAQLASQIPGFSAVRYQKAVLKAFPDLELKQRIQHMVSVLAEFLPEDFAEAAKQLEAALPPRLDPSLQDDDFGKFIWVVPSEYVALHGCSEQYLDQSLDFLEQATQRFSAESAIRPFLKLFPEQTLAAVNRWASHENYHVRRLASEGIRPLLPWAQKVVLPTEQILAVLAKLYRDPTRYVTRSVANNLNDLAKSEPDKVLSALMRWQEKPGDQAEFQWITRHALRTLINQDHPEALQLLGYDPKTNVQLAMERVSTEVKVGDAFELTAEVTSAVSEPLMLTLRIHFLKANGTRSAKTFRVKDLRLKANEPASINKRLPIKPATTRTLYPGTHAAELVVNGQTRWSGEFELLS